MFAGLDNTIVSVIEWLEPEGEALGKEVYLVKEWDSLHIIVDGHNAYCNFYIAKVLNDWK